jgi:hypothetical protein
MAANSVLCPGDKVRNWQKLSPGKASLFLRTTLGATKGQVGVTHRFFSLYVYTEEERIITLRIIPSGN